MSESPRLVLSDLEVGYGRQVVAGPLDAVFDGGLLHVITGPNGSGKTTLLRTALGLLPPIAGRVEGRRITSRSYVPQLRRFDETLPVTVQEVVRMGVPRGVTSAKARDFTAKALREVGLEARRRSAFGALSGGQRQRVLVARALAADATLIALDEPTAGVDQASTTEIWRLLETLTEAGRIVLCVTHDVHAAAERDGITHVLDGGRLVEETGRHA